MKFVTSAAPWLCSAPRFLDPPFGRAETGPINRVVVLSELSLHSNVTCWVGIFVHSAWWLSHWGTCPLSLLTPFLPSCQKESAQGTWVCLFFSLSHYYEHPSGWERRGHHASWFLQRPLSQSPQLYGWLQPVDSTLARVSQLGAEENPLQTILAMSWVIPMMGQLTGDWADAITRDGIGLNPSSKARVKPISL